MPGVTRGGVELISCPRNARFSSSREATRTGHWRARADPLTETTMSSNAATTASLSSAAE